MEAAPTPGTEPNPGPSETPTPQLDHPATPPKPQPQPLTPPGPQPSAAPSSQMDVVVIKVQQPSPAPPGPPSHPQGSLEPAPPSTLPKYPPTVKAGKTPPPPAPHPFHGALRYGSPKMVVTLVVALLLVWTFGWLYIGTAWNPKVRVRHIEVAVLNCDSGLTADQQQAVAASGNPALAALRGQSLGARLLGASVWNRSSSASRVLKWKNFTCPSLPPSSPPGCPPSLEASCLYHLRRSVLHADFFAAVFLPSNLTSSTLNSLGTNTSAQYRPVPLLYFKTHGRSPSSYSFIDAAIRSIHQGISSALASSFAPLPSPRPNPYFLINPLPLQTLDLAPVRYFGQHMAAYLLVLLTWISSIVIVATTYDYRLPIELPPSPSAPAAPRPTRRALLLALATRHITAVLCSLLSCALNLLLVVLLGAGSGHPASFAGRNYGYAVAFLWFGSFSFLSLNALLITVFGPTKYSIVSTFLLVLQLTCSTSIVAHELSSPFFLLGYGLPFTWVVKGLRAVFFGAGTNRLWLCWLVLGAWTLVSVVAAASQWVIKTKGRLVGVGVGEEGEEEEEEEETVNRQFAQAGMGVPLL